MSILSKVKTFIKNAYLNLNGFHTNKKYLVIESDDWGSIRMPSKMVYDKLIELQDNPYEDAFLRNDCLENETDIANLFNVLNSVKDVNGNPAILTANFAVANPDFDKISIEKNEYYYKPFYLSYDEYYGENNILDMIKSGVDRKLIRPQLHCREHLNIKRWMLDLKNGNTSTLLAFKNKMIGVGNSFTKDNSFGYMDAFNWDSKEELFELKDVLKEAADMFEKIFGYKSKTFVASCFLWDSEMEKTLKEVGVLGIQSGFWQYVPTKSEGTAHLKRKQHYCGQYGKYGHVFTVRNCSYEPNYKNNPKECIESCLEQVKTAFNNRKPAIIDSHRFNYVSSINSKNAQQNLLGLKNLLTKIVELYPDVEFISTDEMIEKIKG